MGFTYSRLHTRLNEFSKEIKEFGSKGVYEMEVLGERSAVCCAWETAKEVFEQRERRAVINDWFMVRSSFFGAAVFSNGDAYTNAL